ncbi:MAG: cation:proton antiporter [Verrucomicrobiales bacterium]
MSSFELSVRFFLQLTVILFVCRGVGILAKRFGQPQVVAEMMAGVALGPSLFGLWFPGAQAWLFPKQSMPLLFATCQVGLALYMFLVGMEFRADLFRNKAKTGISVSVAGMVAPFILGAGLGYWLLKQGGFFTAEVAPLEAMLFLGASMCITAFPMLARIIREQGLTGTSLGTLALAAGAMDDAAAWCVLAVVLSSFGGDWMIAIKAIGGGVAYGVLVMTFGRKLFTRFATAMERSGSLHGGLLTGVLACVMMGAWITDSLGIYAVFGAFIMGAAMPKGAFGEEVRRQVEPLTVCLLLPLFFTYSGLNTRLDLVNTPWLWFIALIALVLATLGKGGACWAAARACGVPQREALGIGTLMNARGLMELIILNIGLERGVITPTLFTIMVFMAVITTLMATPLFRRLHGMPRGI